jgi:hypothetical protein
MTLPLLRLSARRAAPPVALLGVATVSLLAIAGHPGRAEIVEVSPRFEEVIVSAGELAASTAWIAGLVVASAFTVLFAARIPDRWFRQEGDWLGTSATSRSAIVSTSLAGTLAGVSALPVIIGLIAGSLDRTPAADSASGGSLLELVLVAGPSRSLVLMPGERFEQALPEKALPEKALPPEAQVRVRVAPALGAEGATTRALIESAGRAAERMVARRAWLEVEAPRSGGLVTVTNVGDGALAVLGPDPVEVWSPSSALAGGHLRLAAQAGLYLAFLAALAFGLGAWMGPGIAGSLALALWLGARMALDSTVAAEALPGGAALAAALDAIAEGRSPQLVPPALALTAAGATLAGFALARTSLGTWHRESRSP